MGTPHGQTQNGLGDVGGGNDSITILLFERDLAKITSLTCGLRSPLTLTFKGY